MKWYSNADNDVIPDGTSPGIGWCPMVDISSAEDSLEGLAEALKNVSAAFRGVTDALQSLADEWESE